MQLLHKDQCVQEYSAFSPPALTVDEGEVFQLETASILTHPEDFPDRTTVPVTGPVYVRGAFPGSTLSVEIIKIELTAGRGAIASKPGKGAWGEKIVEPYLKVVDYDARCVRFNDFIRVPLRPMVGKVGVAPPGEPINSHSPGPHGGNMDITDICTGSTVYLPVFVDGALLACGDVHAAMGDGESEFSAVETESLLSLRCHIIKDTPLRNPRVITEEAIMTVGHGKSLEEACRMALDNMVELIRSNLRLTFVDAAMLISIAADVKINQIVNSLVGVRVSLPVSLCMDVGRTPPGST